VTVAIWIVEENCKGCGLCVKACPYGGVVVEAKIARLTDRCTQCGACIESCQLDAIGSDLDDGTPPDFSDFKDVWVFAEAAGDRLHPVSVELLGEASRLAAATEGQRVCAVLVGDRVEPLAGELIAHGADVVHVVSHAELGVYRTLPYTRVLARLVAEHKPSIVLMGATPLGRDLAPRLSRRLDLGLTADCTELAIDAETGGLWQTRPAFGGNILATIVSPRSRPQMATVRPGVMVARPAEPSRTGEVVHHAIEPELGDLVVRVLERTEIPREGVDLGRARVVVAGGRGMGGREGFKLLFELADALGAEVGGTRITVEEGWLPPERQIGQTGQSVHPELYIACGISGAIQHRAGIIGSRYIVAVNRDAAAPIFEVADYALVGDVQQIVPALIDACERAVGGREA
jgi:electron transfer flavoprotein alpha subunit/NAD-dependent dihydropyrimidine dehydrogenase PreA subunit